MMGRSSRDSLAHIPGDYGFSAMDHTIRFVRNADRFVTHRHERFGPVFKNRILFQRGVIVVDPDAARTVLMDRDHVFSSKGGWDPTIGKLFRRGLMLRDFDDHRMHRRLMQVAFRAEAMSTYTAKMNPIIEHAIAGWKGEDPFSFYRAIKRLTLTLAARVFVGQSPGRDTDAMNRAFMDAVAAAIAPIRTEAPGTSFRRGMKGRRYLEDYFSGLIPARRGGAGTDMLTRLCNAESEDGEKFTRDEIVDHMIFLLLAAHDTTTGTLSSMMWELARRPEWQDRLRDEVRALDEPVLRYEDRDHLELTEWVFREAMRLHPPVPFIPRMAVSTTRLGGYDLPAGAGVAVCSLLIHRLPEYWTDPLRFDPERFGPGREEHRSHSHVYVPFGGGAHTCVGMQFAGLMTKAILVQALQRYVFRLHPAQREQIVTVPIPKPRYGLPLRIEAAS